MQPPNIVKKMRHYLKEAQTPDVDIGALSVDLAAHILEEGTLGQTPHEKAQQEELARMMQDEKGKYFLTAMTDQCFRTNNSARVASQVQYNLEKFGVPGYLEGFKKTSLQFFKAIGGLFSFLFVPLTKFFLRHETSNLIFPGERSELIKHMDKRRKEGVRINLNHLGEAILGEEEAEKRFQIYLEDLRNPHVEYISVKISTIYSQINLLAWDETLDKLSVRFRALLREANTHFFENAKGEKTPKFINLDMEEYRDLAITAALFEKVLSEEEFLSTRAGIVLQAYLPDSFHYQQNLTDWAKERMERGGAPIKIRIVKGANLAMEKVESSLRGWPQAPWEEKRWVDATYKLMIDYGFIPDNAAAVHIGVGSHNLFDIAYALLLSTRNLVTPSVTFEMLEGMADHLRRALQPFTQDTLLYCPAAKKEEFQNAVAYLVRRLDENTAAENFLRRSFGLKVGDAAWEKEKNKFLQSLEDKNKIKSFANRTQSRLINTPPKGACCHYESEPDTDFSLADNRKWAVNIGAEWKNKIIDRIPLVIGGKEKEGKSAVGRDPSEPAKIRFKYTLADSESLDEALNVATEAFESFKNWPDSKRITLLLQIAARLRSERGSLIGVMMVNGGKTFTEADVEVSEAVDFAVYYAKNLGDLSLLEDVKLEGKGPVLVLPPWNFPCAIPAGGILAALAAGCPVLFKPPQETIWIAYELAKIFWDAGVPKDILQFIPAEDDPEGSYLVQDTRIKSIILTGSSETARKLWKMQKGFDLIAETGGKNALIVSNLSDRDLAIKDTVQSAFGHAGQKCSACSLLILFEEVYNDKEFLQNLKDAAASLKVGPAWERETKVNPLISNPSPHLLKALTTLEPGEEWLLKPEQDPENPQLYSPGIKIGVTEGNFTHQTEMFGPLLGVMKAKNLDEAVRFANSVPYGLTSGIHSLDSREVEAWEEKIVAGNLYVNRGITGAIVSRQPFGGTKESQFGPGAKAGGPNYVLQLMYKTQTSPPLFKEPYPFFREGLDSIKDSLESYAFFWNHYFSKKIDATLLLGQDNYFYYQPHEKVFLRIQKGDSPDDYTRVIEACKLTGTPLDISCEPGHENPLFKNESEEEWLHRIKNDSKTNLRARVRLLQNPSSFLENGLKAQGANVHLAPVLANGRIELLHYLREVSLSHDYHRYGNLGEREFEERSPLPVRYTPTQEACSCQR